MDFSAYSPRPYKALSPDERDFVRPAERFVADVQDLLLDTLKIKITRSEIHYFGYPITHMDWVVFVTSDALREEYGIKTDILLREVDNPAYKRSRFFQMMQAFAGKIWETQRR